MKFLCLAILGLAFLLPAGCNSGSSTAPGSSEKPGSDRKLKIIIGDQSVKQNGTDEFTVRASRTNFKGPINLKFADLPAGVSVVTSELVIPENKDTLSVTLKAEEGAKVEKGMAKVVATVPSEKDLPEDVVQFSVEVKAK